MFNFTRNVQVKWLTFQKKKQHLMKSGDLSIHILWNILLDKHILLCPCHHPKKISNLLYEMLKISCQDVRIYTNLYTFHTSTWWEIKKKILLKTCRLWFRMSRLFSITKFMHHHQKIGDLHTKTWWIWYLVSVPQSK